MRCRYYPSVLLALVAMSAPASAQVPAPAPTTEAVPAPPVVLRLKPPKKPKSVYRQAAKAFQSPVHPGALSGNWVRLNTHLMGTVGESTWVNLAQAASIRFYQTGKTEFAAVGVGSNYVSTSDSAEIQKLRKYVLAHQVR